MDSINLIHNDEVRILVIKLDGIDEIPKVRVAHLVVSSLFQLKILDSAAELEKILDNVLLFSTILAGMRLNHKLFTMLSQHLAKRLSRIIHSFVIQKVKLLHNINQIFAY